MVLGVYGNEIDMLVARAPMLLTKHPPIKAFRTWCDRFAQSLRMKYGVADIVHAAQSDQDVQETYTPLLGVVRQLMRACEGSGESRSGTDPEDFLVFIGLLCRIPPTTAGEARVKKLLALAFRGLGPNHE